MKALFKIVCPDCSPTLIARTTSFEVAVGCTACGKLIPAHWTAHVVRYGE